MEIISHEGVIVALSTIYFFSHSQPYVQSNGLKVTFGPRFDSDYFSQPNSAAWNSSGA